MSIIRHRGSRGQVFDYVVVPSWCCRRLWFLGVVSGAGLGQGHGRVADVTIGADLGQADVPGAPEQIDQQTASRPNEETLEPGYLGISGDGMLNSIPKQVSYPQTF